MRRYRGVGITVFICVGCLLEAAIFPGWRDRSLAIATLVVFAFFAVTVIGHALNAGAGRRSVLEEATSRIAPSVRRPPDLVRIESALGWKSYTRGEFEHRAGPLLRELSSYRLKAGSYGDLVTDPESVRPYLSSRLWETVTSAGARRDDGLIDAKLPSEPVRTEEIAAMLDEIEAL
jgi:hypothetical protein